MSEAMQLQVMLTINDRLSKGLHPPTIALRKFSKEAGQALAAISALSTMMRRSSPYAALETQVRAVRLLRKETQQIEKLRRASRDEAGGTRPRSRQQTNLTNDLADDLLMGGAGYGLIQGFRSGTNAAGDYESAMNDLRNSFSEYNKETGKVDESKLTKQIEEAGKQTVQLGNDLMGNTRTYSEIFTALKQGGLQTEEILDGAGKAAAYLANVSGAITQGRAAEQAEELAIFFKMFRLQSKDFEKSVNLFSALKDKFNIDSSAIIESSKYFQGMSNTLGMKGIGGAEETAKLFAFLKRYAGLEGSQAGTTATSLFTMFSTHDKALDTLKKKYGIDLKLFDDKGQFLGLENTFKEMEKLRKLAPEQRIQTLQGIFGEEGSKAVVAMLEQGSDGWRNITNEANKAIPVSQKITSQMQLYNSKTEAVQGSWENLKATMFTPVMDVLKPTLDTLNSLFGKLQEFSKAHPTISKTITLVMGIGGAVLSVTAAIGALKTAVRFFQSFNKFSNAVDSLNNVERSAKNAGDAIAKTNDKAGKFRSSLSAINAIKFAGATAALIGLELVIQNLSDSWRVFQDMQDRGKQDSVENYQRILKREDEGKATQTDYSINASAVLLKLNAGNQLKEALDSDWMSSLFWTSPGHNISSLMGTNPFNSGIRTGYDPNVAKTYVQSQAVELSNPRVMLEALKQLPKHFPKTEDQERVKKTFELAQPESYKAAMQALALEQANLSKSTTETTNAFSQLFKPTNELIVGFGNLNNTNNGLINANTSLTNSLNNANYAANNFANKVNSLKLQSVTVQSSDAVSSPVPKSAVGSVVQRDGLVFAHRGNVITPASLSRRSPGDWLDSFRNLNREKPLTFGDFRSSSISNEQLSQNINASSIREQLSNFVSKNVTVNVNTNVPAGSKAADNPDVLAALIRAEVERAMSDTTPSLKGDNLARLVAYSAARDSERL